MKVAFTRRWSSATAFEVELDDKHKNDSLRTQHGEAIKKALKEGKDLSNSDLSNSDLRGSDLRSSNLRGSDLSGSDLSGSNLRGSNLRSSNLRGSDLSGSNLRGSDLSGSNLRGSDLSGSDLSGSNLSGSNLRSSNLRGSDLTGSDLRGSNLRGSNLSGVPFIKNIHQTVYEAASIPPEALDMSTWHTCATTHCRAGWIVTLAGAGGKALEWAIGTPASAAIIYIKSDPKLEKIPDFYASNEVALADMKRLADLERNAA
jgi:Pentapeptide repeats (8 copies)